MEMFAIVPKDMPLLPYMHSSGGCALLGYSQERMEAILKEEFSKDDREKYEVIPAQVFLSSNPPMVVVTAPPCLRVEVRDE